MTDEHFRELLDFFDLSWRGYRKVRKGVKKRIIRHMGECGVKSMREYLNLLRENPKIREQCKILLTVSISRFFRDKMLWQVLEKKILPDIMKSENPVNVWSAGCACGEEVYTFKIIWEQLNKKSNIYSQLYLLATDINPEYIEKAKAGCYGLSSLKEVPNEIKNKYFEQCKSSLLYKVKDHLKTDIDWKVRDILDTPPEREFHLIFSRNNLLTYYGDKIKEKALENILRVLKPGGYIIKGAHEKIPVSDTRLVKTEFHPHVYQKIMP